MEDSTRAVRLMTASLQDLADDLDVSYAAVRAWGAGRRAPRDRNARALAREARRRGLELLMLSRAIDRELDGSGSGEGIDEADRASAALLDDIERNVGRGRSLVREIQEEVGRMANTLRSSRDGDTRRADE